MPRPHDPRATRQALIAAATELFSGQGYSGTTVEAIARRARVNKAMINYHFGGKRKLYAAIVRELLSSALEELQEVRQSSESAEERLRRFIQTFDRLVRERPAIPIMIVREAVSGGSHLDVKLLPHFLEVFALVREILEQGTREGTFRPVHPLATHLSLIGSMVFYHATGGFRQRMLQAHGGKEVEAGDFMRHTQELFVRGLMTLPADAEPADRPAGGASSERS
jgi:TetR/AcrR family transcriptional regulator